MAVVLSICDVTYVAPVTEPAAAEPPVKAAVAFGKTADTFSSYMQSYIHRALQCHGQMLRWFLVGLV